MSKPDEFTAAVPKARAIDVKRRLVGFAVVGGVVFSQVMTLYNTPVIYTFFGISTEMGTTPAPHRQVTTEKVEEPEAKIVDTMQS